MKTRGRTCNTEERHSAKISKKGLGQQLSRRRTTAQGRGEHWQDGREQRNEAMPMPGKTLGRSCPALQRSWSLCRMHPWLLLPTAGQKQHDRCPALTVAVCGGQRNTRRKHFSSSARVLACPVVKLPGLPALPALVPALLQLLAGTSAKGAILKVSSSINSFSQNFFFLQILENCFVSMEMPVSDTKPFKICWPCHDLHLHINRSLSLSQGINCLPNRILQSHLFRFILALGWGWGWTLPWLQFYCFRIWNFSAFTFSKKLFSSHG